MYTTNMRKTGKMRKLKLWLEPWMRRGQDPGGLQCDPYPNGPS